MLQNLTIGQYLCFYKHRRRNLNAYFCESIFLLKGNSEIQCNCSNDDSQKFKGIRKNGGFDYILREGFTWQ